MKIIVDIYGMFCMFVDWDVNKKKQKEQQSSEKNM
jgi:hypothetical protein